MIITTSFVYLLVALILFNPNFFYIKIAETFAFILFLITYLMTVLINPGIPSRNYYNGFCKSKNNSELNRCSKCNIIVPKTFKIRHCEICDVCVMNYDHHCPWTGKCIGRYNIIFFYFFLTFLIFYMMMSLISFITFIILLEENEIQNKRKIRKI